MSGDSIILRIDEKRMRAQLIRRWMAAAGYTRAICFTCGNAADALRQAGVDVLEVGEFGWLAPRRWWNPEEVHAAWPHLFDATSGHLPLPLVARIAERIRDEVRRPEPGTLVPTGSGETLMACRMAWPGLELVPCDLGLAGTRRSKWGALDGLLGESVVGAP